MKKTGLILILLVSILSNSFAQTGSEKVNLNKLDSYFQKTLEDWDIPGMSIGIVKDGKLIFSKSYGVKETGKSEKPDENTLYAIASNSKAFTSAMMAMLVQEGKLDWDDKVRTYLPYFELYDPFVSRETTIRDILCHQVGLGTFSGDIIWHKSDLTEEEIIRRVKYLPNKFDFRDGYGYSNVMYLTAGEVIHQVTGETWGQNVQERILNPLDMSRTIYSISDLKSKGNFATPHALVKEKHLPIDWVNWDRVGAMGGLISSVKDVSQWMIFNLNHGIWNGDTLLSPESRNTVWKPHNFFTVDHIKPNDFNSHFRAYGLGWGLGDYQGRLSVRHGGSYDGMTSAINLIPDENLGVVVLTNTVKNVTSVIVNYTLDAFLGVSEKDWSAKYLDKREKRKKKDTRISDRKQKQVTDTKPSLDPEKYMGIYHSAIYGNIEVYLDKKQLKIKFEHTPDYSATLKHWHYDVWEIIWDKQHAWFEFGTVKFNMDNYLEITGMDFDVPNDDIFFEELKPVKIK